LVVADIILYRSIIETYKNENMDFGLNDDELDDINEKPVSRVKVMFK
jgi:hypothetical protein